jgi:hypothetical protein
MKRSTLLYKSFCQSLPHKRLSVCVRARVVGWGVLFLPSALLLVKHFINFDSSLFLLSLI